MPAGRPTDYDPAYPLQAEKLVKLGMTDSEIAQFFDINPLTIYRWKAQHEKFCKALIRGKAESDDLVEQSLYKRATGFSREGVKIFMPAGATEPVYAPYVEHYPPDPSAAKLWLTNRRPKEWRDRVVHSNDPDAPIVPILNVTVKKE